MQTTLVTQLLITPSVYPGRACIVNVGSRRRRFAGSVLRAGFQAVVLLAVPTAAIGASAQWYDQRRSCGPFYARLRQFIL